MQKITSFTIDHLKLDAGFYTSRIDGDIYTYDLRTRKPYVDEVIDNVTMHSLEHLIATLTRNSCLADKIIYFGPMGCQTGYYLLLRDVAEVEAREFITEIMQDAVNYNGEMPGNSKIECGNCLTLDLAKAKAECARYLAILQA